MPNEILIIDRNRWARGVSEYAALLRPDNGKMCCLGFECLRRGFTEKEILDRGMPSDLENTSKTGPLTIDISEYECAYSRDSDFTTKAAIINDLVIDTPVGNNFINIPHSFTLSSESEREELLRKEFLTIGVELQFIN